MNVADKGVVSGASVSCENGRVLGPRRLCEDLFFRRNRCRSWGKAPFMSALLWGPALVDVARPAESVTAEAGFDLVCPGDAIVL